MTCTFESETGAEMDYELAVALESAQAAIGAAKERHKRGGGPEANIRYEDLHRIVDALVIATKRQQSTWQYHIEQNEQTVDQLGAMREALHAVVQQCVPGATPTQMMRYDRPWQLAANALYGVPLPTEQGIGAEGCIAKEQSC